MRDAIFFILSVVATDDPPNFLHRVPFRIPHLLLYLFRDFIMHFNLCKGIYLAAADLKFYTFACMYPI